MVIPVISKSLDVFLEAFKHRKIHAKCVVLLDGVDSSFYLYIIEKPLSSYSAIICRLKAWGELYCTSYYYVIIIVVEQTWGCFDVDVNKTG